MTSSLFPDNRWLSSSRPPTIGVVSDYGTESSSDIGESNHGKLFACPFLKRDLVDYGDRLSCSKSGWTSIHGVRQHVYRCHILPIKCPSCSLEFDSARKFSTHLQEEEECDHNLVEADEPILGLESLLKKIRAPKDNVGSPSEEDMWKVMYTALFPEDPKDDIPYPYHAPNRTSVYAHSPYESTVSLAGTVAFPRAPESAYIFRDQRGYFDGASTTSSPLASRNTTRPASTVGVPSRAASIAPSHLSHSESAYGPFADRPPMPSSPRFGTPQPPQSAHSSDEFNDEKPKKKRRAKNFESQVVNFRAWEKPHRTDEHITPGAYRGFSTTLARIFTFFIPAWFLKKYMKMDDLRQQMAFRQKVLFCVILFIIYGALAYFLIIQPTLSCVIKVDIGMFSNDGDFCAVVRNIIYVYMGLGGGFMIVVLICLLITRYKGRSFEEHDALLVMQIPCYNEDEFTLRKTIDSCVQSTYNKKRKLLFIVADGTVPTPGEKPTYKTLLEDIFDHKKDLEIGLDKSAHSYTSYDGDGHSQNRAYSCTGYYRGTPYVVLIKIGREDEKDLAKPGNRGKRDSQLVTYNFFHYVNYRQMWSPLFENLEYKMRTHLNMDARDAQYMLAIDCDTEVDKTGISYLIDKLQKNHKVIGVCGYTGVGNGMDSFVASAQVFEYWMTHACLKAVESVCASVFVLSGCFTIYRLKWPNNRPALLHPLLLEDYGGSYEKTLHEHNLLSIGEDRYLSTLAIRYFGADCRLQYFSAATCTTVVPTTMSVLLDQRRRWTNSLIHCHFAHLNVLPFEASTWTYIRMLFVLGAELFMVFVLPLALPAGLALAIISVILTPYAWVILLAFMLIPVVLCILCMDWAYVPFYLPFFPMIFMFSVVIPIYSMWNQDNFKWGKTRGG